MRRVPLFFGCDAALVSLVAEMLRRVVCVAGQTIISQGDVAKEMYTPACTWTNAAKQKHA